MKNEKISIIIPVFNEEENIKLLFEKLYKVLNKISYNFEIIAINDGSTDNSEKILDKSVKIYKNLKIVNFKRNFGQTAAMMAGFDHSTGDIIIPIDADLQNDPNDIPKLIKKLEEGYDVVSGWRKNRKDSAIKRKFLSKVANWLISIVAGLKLHDYGCTLKAYRKSSILDVKLYGEMHRFIPIYSHLTGAKVTEIPVQHHPRIHGKSKYGIDRILKALLDLIVIRFLSQYFKKPIYLFGGIAFILLTASGCSLFLALYLKFFKSIYLIKTPLPLFSAMTFITGIMCILMGILAEIIMRTYFESQNKKSYSEKNIIESKK